MDFGRGDGRDGQDDRGEERFSIEFALQHAGRRASRVPPPSDPASPVPEPEPFPIVIPGSSGETMHVIDGTGTLTPVNRDSGPGTPAETPSRPPSSMEIDAHISHMEWIPSYLNLTAYGERFSAFTKERKGHPRRSRTSVYQAAAGTERGGLAKAKSVSPTKFQLPQIFPSRGAAQLDALSGRRSWSGGAVAGSAAGGVHGSGATDGSAGAAGAAAGITPAETFTSRTDAGLPPLPSAWACTELDGSVTLADGGREVEFGLPGKGLAHSTATLRSNVPISPLCGVYYFEVEVLRHGADELVIVGVCDEDTSLSKIPGAEPSTWGYHSDDGRVSASQGPGKQYGPKIAEKDVIGCGINFRKNSVFYTRNGVPLGTAFQDVRGSALYASIGLRSGEHVTTNFGHKEFYFDIDKYVYDEKQKVLRDAARATPSPAVAGDDPDANGFIRDLVWSYFMHLGYLDTAKAFENDRAREARIGTDGDVNAPAANAAANGDEMELDGDGAGNALDVAPSTADDATNGNADTSADAASSETLNALSRKRIRKAVLDGDIDGAFKLINLFYPGVLDSNPLINFRLRCRKFVELVRATIPSDDDHYHNNNNNQRAAADGPSTARPPHAEALAAAIEYGQQLRRQYGADKTPEIAETLSAVFSLLAYEDPRVAPDVSHLLDHDELAPLAEDLNSAILVSQGKPGAPPLSILARHATQCVWELADHGYNSAALVNVKDDFLS